MPFWKRKPRRVENLLGEGQVPWHERLRDPKVVRQLIVVAGFYLATLLIVQVPDSPHTIHKGTQLKHPILSRVEFTYVDDKIAGDLKELAAQRVPGVYALDLKAVADLKKELPELLGKVAETKTFETLPADLATAWPLKPATFAALKKGVADADALAAAQEAVDQAMAALAQPGQLLVIGNADYEAEVLRSRQVRDIIDKLPTNARPEISAGEKRSEEVLTIRLPPGEEKFPRMNILRTPGEVQSQVASLIATPLDVAFDRPAIEWLAGTIARRIGPTLKLDQAATENRRMEAMAAVGPYKVTRMAGTALVRAGTEIADEDLKILDLEEAAYRHELRWIGRVGEVLGGATIIAMVVGLLAVYVWRFQPRVSRSTARSAILAAVCLAVVGASKAIARADGYVETHAVLLTTLAMILTIAYSQVFAMAISWTLIFLIAIGTRSDFDWMMTATAGTFTAILTLGEINKRSKLIQVGALAGLAFLAAVGGLYLWRLAYTDLTGPQVIRSCLLYFGSGLAAGFLVLGLLPFIERLFGIATNISLLELCDVNQPALRRLAMEAPGTYAHSLYIGSLAQAAAEAVGAKSLLARVGAYFHDIGKVNKPHYFVENALGKTEAHEGLTPAMSRLVIMSHVKDGLEMADRLGLPRYIRQFIAEHHGTTVTEYFYHEAEVQAERMGSEPPHDTDYRYPGPKPRSRETAIVMLADTVEGTTRALKDPTAARVQATVHEMVMKRLMDGQLDQSGLTLSDLHKIDETLTKALLSVYHTRVPYPTDRPVPEASGEGTKKEEPGGLKGAWRA